MNQKEPQIPNYFYDKFSPSGQRLMSARMWAALSDEREKTKVFENPLFMLDVDGKQVKFYLFMWNDDAVFHDGHKMHISVMAQEIAKIYPAAVFKFHNRYFVLLANLPKTVTKHMLAFRNPIIDLAQFVEQ